MQIEHIVKATHIALPTRKQNTNINDQSQLFEICFLTKQTCHELNKKRKKKKKGAWTRSCENLVKVEQISKA